MPNSIFTCHICEIVKGRFANLAKHLKAYHEHKPGFSVTCHYDGCNSSYKHVDSYCKHVNRKHPLLLINMRIDSGVAEETTTDQVLVHENNATLSEDMEVIDDPTVSPDSDVYQGIQTSGDLLANIDKNLTDFILSVREQHLLPSSVQEKLASCLNHTVTTALSDYSQLKSNEKYTRFLEDVSCLLSRHWSQG